MWFGIDEGVTVATTISKFDVKYVQNLIRLNSDLPKMCLGVGDKPIYEPYVGGIPSPSPDYPQEIKSVVNPIVKVYGKNMMPYPKDNTVRVNGLTLIAKDGKYTLVGKPTENTWMNIYPQVIDHTYSDMLSEKPLPTKGKKLSMINGSAGYSLNFRKVSNRDKVFGIEHNKVTLADEDSNGVFLYIFNIDKTYNDTFEIMISDPADTTSTVFEPYTEQEVSLPYTLNAIPVSSGGNVTINGQQYIADRVVEKDGVFGIERNIREIHTNTKTMNNSEEYPGWNKVEGVSDVTYYSVNPTADSRKLTYISNFTQDTLLQNNKGTNNILYCIKHIIGYSQSELIAKAIDVDMYIRLQDAIFEPLPGDIQAKLRTFVTNYPVTNISVTSDQLDGYTVFNYPISMANGWNYVKQQLNDNRDYIYDMDIQSAEAYVNSEYAVALTELEV